jgi:hypothetical protein
MKLIIFLGVLVIFVSCIFIFFTFDAMMKSKFVCTYTEKLVCNVSDLNMTIVFGILVVGMFLFVDTLVIYLMVRTWVPDLLMYG